MKPARTPSGHRPLGPIARLWLSEEFAVAAVIVAPILAIALVLLLWHALARPVPAVKPVACEQDRRGECRIVLTLAADARPL